MLGARSGHPFLAATTILFSSVDALIEADKLEDAIEEQVTFIENNARSELHALGLKLKEFIEMENFLTTVLDEYHDDPSMCYQIHLCRVDSIDKVIEAV